MEYFQVVELDKLQSYKDRKPDWIKLYMKFIDDHKYASLPDAQKGQLVSLWLFAARYGKPMPYDATFIASKINATEPVRLSTFLDVRFIEKTTQNQQVHTLSEVRTLDKKREEEIRREKNKKDFVLFYNSYPNKKNKTRAYDKFMRLNPDQELFNSLLTAIEAQKAWRHAKEQAGEWVADWPNPPTWINQRRWEDELEPVKKNPKETASYHKPAEVSHPEISDEQRQRSVEHARKMIQSLGG